MLQDFPTRAEAEILISAFFLYAEANWYYFDESSFRSQLFGLYDGGFSTTSTSLKFICLAYAVFAMGSQFVHLYQKNRLDNPNQTEIPGSRYFQLAEALVPRVIASPSLEGLLSCLLLALYVLPIENANYCYNYLGISLRMAICLGLHRGSSDSTPSPPSAREVCNRIFWTTYNIERYECCSRSTGFSHLVDVLDGLLLVWGIPKRSRARTSNVLYPSDETT